MLETYHLISEYQHGFCHGHSTDTLLLQAIHDWSYDFEKCHSVHCVMLDFAKAFDSVPHCRLLLKLKSLSIDGRLLS